MAEPTDDTELTPNQARFVDEYLVDLNATRAAIRAGYSEKSAAQQGWDLLRNPKVQALISKKRAELARKTEITAERVLLEIKRIAFANMRDVATWNEYGVQFKNDEDLSDEVSPAVSELSSDVIRTKSGEPIVKMKVKLHDKMKALDMLGRYLDLFKDGNQNGGLSGPPKDLTEADLEAMSERARNRLLKQNEPSE